MYTYMYTYAYVFFIHKYESTHIYISPLDTSIQAQILTYRWKQRL